jgi:CubicO group peptidase (beta-lactamase class C family)
MSSGRLARLVDFGAFNGMDSLLVTRHGRIVLEATYAPFRADLKHRVYSVTKSVVSTLVGMALGDGLLDSTDRRVVDFFPDRTIANLDEAKKAITVQQLLDMRSGLTWQDSLGVSFNAMERSPDWQQFVLDHPMAVAPGTSFNYSGGNSHLLSAILSKVTGKSAYAYAGEKLFGPLGIDDVLWRADPQGVSGGGAGLYLKPRDMAKIGYLWLRGGVWEEKQILPASWIEGVRAANVEIPESWARDLRYGLQFWVMPGRDVWMAIGTHRQLVVVMPKLDIVAVVTSSARFPSPSARASTPRYGFGTLVDYLAAAVTSDGAVAADPAAAAELAERVKAAGIEQPALTSPGGSKPSPMAKAVSGKTWRFDFNPMRVKSYTLKLDDPQPSYEYELDGGPPGAPAGRFSGPVGFDGRFAVGGRMPYGPSAARGAWSADGGSLVIEVQTLGNDDAARMTHVFGDKTIELSIEWAGGFRAKLEGRAAD